MRALCKWFVFVGLPAFITGGLWNALCLHLFHSELILLSSILSGDVALGAVIGWCSFVLEQRLKGGAK